MVIGSLLALAARLTKKDAIYRWEITRDRRHYRSTCAARALAVEDDLASGRLESVLKPYLP